MSRLPTLLEIVRENGARTESRGSRWALVIAFAFYLGLVLLYVFSGLN